MLVFYEHSGIDGRGTEPFQFRTSGGASTLTQQFAKQLHGEGSKFYLLELYKKKEWIIAIR
jgi:membrane peptidoglycan carboxypeptidase